MKSFGTNVEGNENIRNEFITKALRLKKQIEKLRKDQKEGSPEYNEKVEKYRMIINKIGWNYEAH